MLEPLCYATEDSEFFTSAELRRDKKLNLPVMSFSFLEGVQYFMSLSESYFLGLGGQPRVVMSIERPHKLLKKQLEVLDESGNLIGLVKTKMGVAMSKIDVVDPWGNEASETITYASIDKR